MVNNFDEIFKGAFAQPVVTERLEIRSATAADADALAALFSGEGMVFACEWMEWPEGDYDSGYIRDDVLPHLENMDRGKRLRLFMFERESGAAVGEFTFWQDGQDGQDRTMLSYFVLPSRRRQGYAMETAAACLTRAAGAGIGRLHAEVGPGNTASLRILRRLGFAENGPVVSKIQRHIGETLIAFEKDMRPPAPQPRSPAPF